MGKKANSLQLIHSLIINEGLGFWRIGKVLSGKKGGIASLCSGTTGPEKVKTWNYWNGEKWITTPNVSDRVTISLEGMYNMYCRIVARSEDMSNQIRVVVFNVTQLTQA